MGRRSLEWALLAAIAASDAAAFPALVLGENDPDTTVVSGKVVIVRQGRKTVLTVAPEVRSAATRLAVLVPVPGPIEAKNANVAEPGLIRGLDAWAAPRLVSSKDSSPCSGKGSATPPKVVALGVPPLFEHGDYDFEPLNGKSVANVKKHLGTLGFKVPPAGEAALRPYLNAGYSLLVGVVRLASAPAPTVRLKAFQVAYESDAYKLPLGAGPVLGPGPLDLTVYAVSEQGRVDVESLPGAPRAPTGMHLPEAVLADPAGFYAAVLGQLALKRRGTVVVEHAAAGAFCQPCAGSPLTLRDFRKLGVFWIPKDVAAPKDNLRGGAPAVVTTADVGLFVTRLHVLYGAKQQKSDLALRETSDKNVFQSTFVVKSPYLGATSCPAGVRYAQGLAARREAEAQALARLTGWEIAVARRGPGTPVPQAKRKTWVDDLWEND